MSRVRGANRLRRKLQRIDPEVTREVKDVLLDGAEMMRRTMIELVPKGDPGMPRKKGRKPAGNLARILAEPRAVGRKSGGFQVEVGFRTKRQKRDGFYAPFVEFGTKGGRAERGLRSLIVRRGAGRGRRRKRVTPRRAQPFMRPALEINRRPFRRRRERAINLALRRAAS